MRGALVFALLLLAIGKTAYAQSRRVALQCEYSEGVELMSNPRVNAGPAGEILWELDYDTYGQLEYAFPYFLCKDGSDETSITALSIWYQCFQPSEVGYVLWEFSIDRQNADYTHSETRFDADRKPLNNVFHEGSCNEITTKF